MNPHKNTSAYLPSKRQAPPLGTIFSRMSICFLLMASPLSLGGCSIAYRTPGGGADLTLFADREPYQQFFDALSKAMFLDANLIE